MTNQQPVANLDQLMEEWKKVVDVQMHFNDLIMRNRQIVMTSVLTVFGAAAFSLQFPNLILDISYVKFHAAAAIVLFGLGLLLSMFFLDYFYYFRLLLGAVTRGEDIERILQNQSSNVIGGLTLAISQSVVRGKASKSLKSFYLIPLMLGVLFLLFIFIGYPSGEAVKKTTAPAGAVQPTVAVPPEGRR